MKSKITPKTGILVVFFILLIALIIIGLNALKLRNIFFNEEDISFEIADFLSDEMFCDILYSDIENIIEEKNFCDDNEDCMVLDLGSAYGDFNCYYFINKNIDGDIIYEKISEYKERCVGAVGYCNALPAPTCVDGRCVYLDDNY